MSIIVSLTSTSERISILRYTLLSLLDQSINPDRIIVCLSKEPYLVDKGVDELPRWLKQMVSKKEIEIDWVENTGPCRKLIPVYRQANNEDWIITC